ncbi:putative monocarboxylate transporter [Rhodotorula diobovata]|uniref:Putative monocarboxylate transporter n=1 Tax=Rhodotorula diobovata TaxID=5288 RepID=A0A5C5G564_9BASI|nr:putative monocarboxylate transporter [Rhodotorula diobovata]
MTSQASLASSSNASFFTSSSGDDDEPVRASMETASPRPSGDTDTVDDSVYSSTSTPSQSRRASLNEGKDADARSATPTLSGGSPRPSHDATDTPRAPSPALPRSTSRQSTRSDMSETAVELAPPVEAKTAADFEKEEGASTLTRTGSRQSRHPQLDHTVLTIHAEPEGAHEGGQVDGGAEPYASAAGSFDTSRSNYEDGKTDVASVAHILPASAAALTAAGLPTDHSTASYPPSCKSESKRGLSPSASPGLALEAAEAAAAPPDGGLRAWLNVLGGFLVLASSFGVVNALGAFQAYYEHFLFPHKSSSEIAWIGSAQLCLFFLCALVAGPLFDKGHFRAVMAFGSSMWLLSIFLIPEAKTYGQMMVIQGIVGGLGVGFLFLPSMSIQSHWFAKRRALAIGIVASGSSVGGVGFPIMLNRLFANPDVGFKNGVRACGYVVLACLIVANLIMRPNPSRKHIKKPPPPPLKEMFSAPFICLVLGSWLLSFGVWFPNFYEQLYFQANGASPNAVTYALAFFNTGSFFGRIIPNLIADYIGPFNVQAVCCFGAGTVIFLMRVMKSSDALLILHAVLYGFFSGAFISLVSPVTVSISRDLSEIGLRQGIAFLITAGSSVACNPIAGRLLAMHDGEWIHPIVFAGTMVLAGSVAMTVGTVLRAKEKGTWRV